MVDLKFEKTKDGKEILRLVDGKKQIAVQCRFPNGMVQLIHFEKRFIITIDQKGKEHKLVF